MLEGRRAAAVGAVRARTEVRARGLSWRATAAVLCLLAGALLVGVLVGPVDVGAWQILRSAAAHLGLGSSPLSPAEEGIVWDLRLPRVVLGALVGGMLSLSGAAYQGVFCNPLADPYLLGVAAGAGLGATLAIVYGGAAGSGLLPLAAFAGASAGVALAYAIGRAAGRSTAALVLAGVTVTSFLTAVQTFVQQQHADALQEIFAWILGRLSTSGWTNVLMIAPYAAIAAVVLLGHRRLLDVLSLGDDEAAALGVDVVRVRLVVVLAATIAAASAVATSGLVPFVGLIVPHAVRLVAGASYRIVLPLSLLGGAAFLVLADVLARTAIAPAELPIGVVTAFFGAPFFAVILRTARSVR